MPLSANEQRVLIALQQSNGPLSAYAVLDRVRRPGFSAPTQVYRALNRLIERQLVHRLETLNAYVTRSHAQLDRAGFLAFTICDTCGQIDEVVDRDLNHALSRCIDRHDFAVDRSAIEIHGQCRQCAESAQTDPSK